MGVVRLCGGEGLRKYFIDIRVMAVVMSVWLAVVLSVVIDLNATSGSRCELFITTLLRLTPNA